MTPAQRRAVVRFRRRRLRSGIARFEVSAPSRDKELVREVARRLSLGDQVEFRAGLREALGGSAGEPGAIWQALRRSPLVGSELVTTRDRSTGRKVEL